MQLPIANLNLLKEFYCAVEEMQKEFAFNCCPSCRKIDDHEHFIELTASSSCRPEGPDKISVQECLDRVHGTANRMYDLIAFAPKVEVQFLLRNIVKELACQAADCCMAGGLWKACLGPLLNKWCKWNEKYRVFGIPPDPAWD